MKKRDMKKLVGVAYGISDKLVEIRLELEALRDELHEAGLEIHETSRETADALDNVCDCIAGCCSKEHMEWLGLEEAARKGAAHDSD